jgi:hypothetical protein
MNLLVCLLLAVVSPVEQAEEDAISLFPADASYVKYLYLDNVEEKEREHYMAVVSFTLNSVSNKKKIVKPVFVNKDKTLIRFDIRDYGIDVKAYNEFPTDPYTKKIDKLKVLSKSENPIMRADWFIIKAMQAPLYYKLMGVSDLKDFRKRHGHDPDNAKKLKVEQAAIVVLSNLARNTRYIKRTVTVTGAIWESRDSSTIDYLTDLLTDKYDSVQVLAFNSNGLLSYFAADNKGKSMDHLAVDIAVDHSRAFEPDLTVRVARNCVACHSVGVLPIDDSVRSLIKKDIKLLGPDKDAMDRLSDLFGAELPIKKDQTLYAEALMKATDMKPMEFTHKFIAVHKTYYADLTLEHAAKEMGMTPDELKKDCLQSGHAHLVRLALDGKIPRVHFEQAIKGK